MKIPNAVCMHIVAGSGGVEKPPFDYLGHRRDMSDRHFQLVVCASATFGLCLVGHSGQFWVVRESVKSYPVIRRFLQASRSFSSDGLKCVQNQSDIMIQSAKPGRSPIIHSFGGLGITVPLASNSLVVSNLDLFSGVHLTNSPTATLQRCLKCDDRPNWREWLTEIKGHHLLAIFMGHITFQIHRNRG